MDILEALVDKMQTPTIIYERLELQPVPDFNIGSSRKILKIGHLNNPIVIYHKITGKISSQALRSGLICLSSETQSVESSYQKLVTQIHENKWPRTNHHGSMPIFVSRIGLIQNCVVMVSTFYTLYFSGPSLYQESILEEYLIMEASDNRLIPIIKKLDYIYSLFVSEYYNLHMIELADFKKVRRYIMSR